MLAATRAIPTVKTTIWTGRTLSAFAILFLAFDSLIKVLNLAPAVDATTQLGYPASLVITLGVLELICLAIYTIPRTAVPGVILLTGYLAVRLPPRYGLARRCFRSSSRLSLVR